MKTIPMTTAILLIAATGTGLWAQDDPMRDTDRRTHANPQFASVETLLGAEVRLQATTEQRREAQIEGEQAERPTGSIEEILVDPQNGEMKWAVVALSGETGDKSVAIPSRALKWDANSNAFRLSASPSDLEKLPSVELEGPIERGLEASIQAAENAWREIRTETGEAIERLGGDRRPVDASGRRERNGHEDQPRDRNGREEDPLRERDPRQQREMQDQQDMQQSQRALIIDGKHYQPMRSGFVRASRLDDAELYTNTGDQFGDVSKVIADVSAGRIEFLVVDSGGVIGIGEKSYLLPFSILNLRKAADPEIGAETEGEIAFATDWSSEELEKSVRYEEPEQGVLDSATAERAKAQCEDHDRGQHHGRDKDKERGYEKRDDSQKDDGWKNRERQPR